MYKRQVSGKPAIYMVRVVTDYTSWCITALLLFYSFYLKSLETKLNLAAFKVSALLGDKKKTAPFLASLVNLFYVFIKCVNNG